MRTVAIALSLASVSSFAQAATLTVQVRSDDGEAVADAVVTVDAPSASAAKASSLKVTQKNLAFDPFVLIVPVGAAVAFPNFDRVSHHVYSFSPAKKFEIQLYGHDETRSVVFPTPGIVAIGCNIHDKMTAFLYVTETAFAAKTDANGTATILNVPEGAVNLRVWHPHAAAPQQQVEQPLTVTSSGATVAAKLELRAQRRTRHGSY